MALPSSSFMSLLGNSVKNYGSNNMLGLGMFAAGSLTSMGAAGSNRSNGVTAGNSLAGMAGLGMMGYGAHRLGAKSLLSTNHRGLMAQRMQNSSIYLKANNYHRGAAVMSKAASYTRKTTRL